MDERIKNWLFNVKQAAYMHAEYDKWISEALTEARLAPFPAKVRPAVAADIVVGAVIWYKEGIDGPHWHCVSEVIYPGDEWKGYCAEDGCRYGLDDAYVEVEDAT